MAVDINWALLCLFLMLDSDYKSSSPPAALQSRAGERAARRADLGCGQEQAWLTPKAGKGVNGAPVYLPEGLSRALLYWSVAPALVTFHPWRAWRCKPLAGLAFELLLAPAASKAPGENLVFALGSHLSAGQMQHGKLIYL